MIINCLKLYSQCISVELSIRWSEEKTILENECTCIPLLNITYRNNTDQNFYFMKVQDYENQFPEFLGIKTPENSNSPFDLSKYQDYSGTNFYIDLRIYPQYLSTSWEVIPDSIIPGMEHEIAAINNDLVEIYNSLSPKSPDTIMEFKLDFKTTDITPDAIMSNHKNRFVFLKAGESYTDTFNLIGLKILRGTYTIYLEQDSLLDNVITSVYDKTHSKNIRLALPSTINEYTLYSGAFYSNKITITL